jgi:CheY-like chemotaxis protein
MSEMILYVEDGPDDVFFMQRAFQKIAPEVDLLVMTTGNEAADFFTSMSVSQETQPLALVLLDLNLPGQSGIQVLSKIRNKSRYSQVPVILFTASSQQSDVDSCYAAGCNAYVVKPNDPEGLKALVSVINEFWIKANNYPQIPPGAAITSADALKPNLAT